VHAARRPTPCHRLVAIAGRAFAGTLLLAFLACSTPTEPAAGITLLVTNGTCRFDVCDTVRVLGFPAGQPLTPGGYWSLDLGLVAGPSACLTLPPSAEFHVIDASNADTTTVTWTTSDSLSLGSQPAGAPLLFATPSMTGFVPERAEGWRVTLPGGPGVVPASACMP